MYVCCCVDPNTAYSTELLLLKLPITRILEYIKTSYLSKLNKPIPVKKKKSQLVKCFVGIYFPKTGLWASSEGLLSQNRGSKYKLAHCSKYFDINKSVQ